MIRKSLLCLAICVEILIANDSNPNNVDGAVEPQNKIQKYSFPPNNTPISKVYVFGRPLYVRPPFVIPQRDTYRRRHDNQVFRDDKPYGGEPQIGTETVVEQSVMQESLVNQFFTDSDPTRYKLPERPFLSNPNPIPYAAAPPLEPKQKYPLPQCYTNDSGFMCCNPKLEQVMRETYNELSADPKWQSCNVQRIANTLQNKTQSTFNMDFEALAGLGDFASKTHFYSDLICKIEVDGRFMLSYATPNRHQVLYQTEPIPLETSTIGYV